MLPKHWLWVVHSLAYMKILATSYAQSLPLAMARPGLGLWTSLAVHTGRLILR